MIQLEETLDTLTKLERTTNHNGYMRSSEVKEFVLNLINAYEDELKAKNEELKKTYDRIAKLGNTSGRLVPNQDKFWD